ncbi:PAS domain-containing protein [Sneathiella sp. P13V-1]|uniref:PAS domain-containing sensor histidine kinase n=1 Tax=Sneathiella sp. P13V-1 TaxID=2697366 RepID=UPI00187BC34D|nr:PAS domain-containing sensor histidine kinase [Sneathiella sp. P13V-1]MBE7637639.1 PAS domain-containing protein [Sneathiella sp. P13V-1]
MTKKTSGSVVSLRGSVKNTDSATISGIQSAISRDFFDAVFDQAQAMYIARPDGSVLYVNSGYQEIFSTSSNSRAKDKLFPSLSSDHLEIINRIAVSKEAETKQVAIETVKGTEYYLSRHFPITDNNDNFIAICGSFINSTRQVNAEIRLRLEKRRFLDITRAASDWIWETDADGSLTYVSDRAVQAVGLPPLLLKGKQLTDLGTFNAETGRLSKAEAAIAKHIPFRAVPMTIIGREGDKKIFNISGVPVFNEKGRFVGYRGTSDDITARLVAEDEASSSKADLEMAIAEITRKNMQLEMTAKKAVAAARAKDEFLATMSHELRTPLNAIIGFAEVMGMETFGPLEGKYKEYVSDILNSGRHLLSLIEDILDIARIESDRIPVEIEKTSLRQMIEDATSLVSKHADEKSIDISDFVVNEDFDLKVDPTRCLQIIVNILGNAVKFTQSGGSVGLETRIDGSSILLTIWDTGPGIDASELDNIFEAFRQAHNGIYSRGEEGVGLGLTLSLKLARLMEGDITVESEVGVGSRFTIRLPLML